MIAPKVVVQPLEFSQSEGNMWGYEVIRKGTLSTNGLSMHRMVYEVRGRELGEHIILEERYERSRLGPYVPVDVRDLNERDVADEEIKERAMVQARAHLKKLKPTLVNRTSRE